MTLLYACLALIAFAANSVLCRLALANGAIDPASFTTIRFGSGALTLLLVVLAGRGRPAQLGGTWVSALVLALYAVPFSFAYTGLSAGTGALILFGTVQVTMWFGALRSAEKPAAQQWAGVALAFGGLVYLVLPGLTAPPAWAAALMAIAGFSWGLYSLRGRGTSDPLAHTLGNFVRVMPWLLGMSAVSASQAHARTPGVLLAVMSGAFASGLGYVCWYAALRTLTAVRAAVVQLLVPVLATVAGVVLLGEAMSLRLAAATLMVLGGIALTLRR